MGRYFPLTPNVIPFMGVVFLYTPGSGEMPSGFVLSKTWRLNIRERLDQFEKGLPAAAKRVFPLRQPLFTLGKIRYRVNTKLAPSPGWEGVSNSDPL